MAQAVGASDCNRTRNNEVPGARTAHRGQRLFTDRPAAANARQSDYGKVVYSRYKPGTIVKNTFLDQFGYRSLSDIRFSQMALSNSLIRSRAQIFCGTDSGAAVLPLLFALLDA